MKLPHLITILTLLLYTMAGPPELSAQGSGENDYASTIAMADKYFSKGDYINAKASYQIAAKLNPDEEYPRSKLQETIGLIRAQMESNARYAERIQAANSYFDKQEYDNAVTIYREALEILPDDAYAKGKLEEIGKIKADINLQGELYAAAIRSADGLFNARQYEKALLDYKKATTIKPDEQYPKDRIAEIEALLARNKANAGEYNNIVRSVDPLLQRRKYDEAITQLEAAAELKPGEAYPREKLAEVRKLKMEYDAYLDIISQADELYISRSFQEAKAKYQQARQMPVADEYPGEMIGKIDIALLDIASSNQASYILAVAKADKYYSEQDYENAMAEYKHALTFQPGESYAQGKISEINNTLNLRRTQDEAYKQSIAKADVLMAEKSYEQAREIYVQAQNLKPLEQYPKVKLEEIAGILDEIKNKSETYEKMVDGADKLFFADNYEQAKEQYQKALEIYPTEKYPAQQISMINEILGLRDTYIKAINKADALLMAQDYQTALLEYRNAAKVQPEEAYPAEKIREIEGILQQQAVAAAAAKEQEGQYLGALTKADALFREKKWEDALLAYRDASAIKPEESYPKQQLEIIDARLREIARQVELDKNYNALIARAGEQMLSQNYPAARSTYAEALALKPAEILPQQKITEIDGIMQQLAAAAEAKAAEERKTAEAAAAAKEKEARYAGAVANGDDLFQGQKYAEAQASYREASVLKPEEAYPKLQLEAIDNLLREIARQEELDKNYNALIDKASGQMGSQNYPAARSTYEEALALKPSETLPQQKMIEIDGIMQRLAEAEKAAAEAAAAEKQKEERYATTIASGDRLFQGKQYTEAQAAYREASGIKPEEAYPKQQLDAINDRFREIARQEELDKNYDALITRAGGQMESQNYPAARSTYEEALTLKPAEALPQQKIAEIEGILQQMAAAEKAAAEAAAVAKEREERYAAAIADGDGLFQQKQYAGAQVAYREASSFKPEETYPKKQLEIIDTRLKEIAAKEELDRNYQAAITRGGELESGGDLTGALAAFTEAQALKPGEALPKDRIAGIRKQMDQLAAEEAFEKQFNGFMETADKAFSSGLYKDARAAYQSALDLKPDHARANERLKEADDILATLAREEELTRKYQEAVAYGDKHMSVQDYVNAKYEFQVANSLKPAESYPLEKLSEIEGILAEQQRQKELNQKYAYLLSQADELYRKENFEDAISAYEEALTYKHGDLYAEKQIVEIKRLVASRAEEVEKSYNVAITKGDNAFNEQSYEMARLQFERALELKPAEVYPQERLKEVNDIIARERQVMQEAYDKAIADADKFYAAKIYDSAIESYRTAADLKKEEEYPTVMIHKILKIFSERAIVTVNKDPLLVTNSTTRKFDFMPVPVKDRKSNYLYFKARNASPANHKLIISYGRDQTKNGGVVVKIPAGTEYNEFLVRISAQYKWFSDDNNWITFYPEGGDLEVSLLQISYSD